MAHQDPSANGQDAADGAPVPQYRGLKAAVIIMGVLLVVGFIIVFSTIIYRVVNPSETRTTPQADRRFDIEAQVPAGGEIGRIIADGDRLAVEVRGAQEHQIIIFDLRRGQNAGRIRLQAE